MAISFPPPTTSQELSADEVRRQMRAIRRELGADVEEVIEHAERLMDWRYHINRYPWAAMGASAVLGYFLVPNRTTVVQTSDSVVQQMVDRLPAAIQEKLDTNKPSLVSSLITLGSGFVMKAAMSYAAQQASKFLGPQPAGQPAHEETHHYG